MQLDKHALLTQGILVDYATPQERLAALLHGCIPCRRHTG
jgi:hypothetical protein